MTNLESVLNEILQSEIEEFKDLVGDYSFQGHVSHDKEISLRGVSWSQADPTPYSDVPGARGGTKYYMTPGGFWTSTIYKGYEGFITKWAKAYFRPTEGKYFHAYTIINDPNILRFSSEEKVDDFYHNSKYSIKKKDLSRALNWKKVHEDYDAVHVYGSALDTVYFKNWSVESTVWFDPQKYLKKQFRWKITDELSVDPPS